MSEHLDLEDVVDNYIDVVKEAILKELKNEEDADIAGKNAYESALILAESLKPYLSDEQNAEMEKALNSWKAEFQDSNSKEVKSRFSRSAILTQGVQSSGAILRTLFLAYAVGQAQKYGQMHAESGIIPQKFDEFANVLGQWKEKFTQNVSANYKPDHDEIQKFITDMQWS